MVTRSAAGQAGQHARGGLRQRLETERPDASAPSARAVRPAPSGAAASHRARLTSGDALDALALGFGVTSGSATQSPSTLESGSYPSDLQTRHGSAVSAGRPRFDSSPGSYLIATAPPRSHSRDTSGWMTATRVARICRSGPISGSAAIAKAPITVRHIFPFRGPFTRLRAARSLCSGFARRRGRGWSHPNYGQVTLRARKCCAGAIVRGNLIR